MSRPREWVLPVALGLLAAGLVWVLPAPHLSRPAHDALPEPVEEPLGLAWAFREARAPSGTAATLLAVGEPDADLLRFDCPAGARDLPLQGLTDALWRLDVPAGCATPDGAIAVHADDGAPVFGADGHNATEVTVYVFDADGRLLASNAGATQRNRYRLSGDFVTVSDRPWYLGDGPVPDGMRVPEGYVDFARQRLAGLPVGGVGWGYVPEHEYDWLVGALWVTARVDALVDAP